ncbi:MAG TPA: AMP-binding protein [Blastocatellia bacterium]|jgi:fatty-acyl-CoA synthase|nr:AMP-binding protein [Blastocatellia bacterium]
MPKTEVAGKPVAYRDVKVGELLTLLARDWPENEALIYPDRGLRYDFAELEWLTRQIAKGLLSQGVSRNDRVALWAPNIPEWVVLQFALAKIGAVLVTVNTNLRASEIEYLLRQSETSTLITVRGFREVDYVETLYEIVPELRGSEEGVLRSVKLPHLRNVIYIGDEHPAGMIRYDSLLARSGQTSDEQLDAHAEMQSLDDVINMQYTSGTTGFPKGVMLTHRNIVNNAYWLGEGIALTPRDRVCVPVPFFHCFGCVIGVLGAYTHAAALVPLEWFEPLRVLQYIEGERCTAVYGVPTMFIAELEQLDFHSFNLSSLRTGIMAGSLCPEALMRRVMERMNLTQLTIAYGLTEASPGITLTPRDDSVELRTQTVGKVLPEMEVKVVDPATGDECAAGHPGELCCRGYNVMKGYYRDPGATAAAIDGDGWLHTGDQAAMDQAGYVRITGRIKELIIRGGENIAPKEIEDLLRQYEKIADVYVYGIPDEKYGEEVAAAVRLKPGETATVEEIRQFCDGRIAKFKVPRQFRFVESFPMTASGKVQKFKLREMHLRMMNHE